MGSKEHPTPEKIIHYFHLFKQLRKAHIEYGFGNSPRLSEGFTENICCHLYGFERAKKVKRKYDVIDHKNGLKVEVKGFAEKGKFSTSINPKSFFDVMLIVAIDFDDCLVSIYRIHYDEMKAHLETLKGNRPNINLRSYTQKVNPEVFLVGEKTILPKEDVT